MNKRIIYIFTVLTILTGCVLTSCKDDNDSSLSGVYAAATDSDGFCHVYEFTSKNNVIFYPYAHKGSGKYYDVWYNDKIGGSNYYYSSDFDQSKSYTYVLEDGVLIIPMQGTMFSVSGNTLREDGSNRVYTKQ